MFCVVSICIAEPACTVTNCLHVRVLQSLSAKHVEKSRSHAHRGIAQVDLSLFKVESFNHVRSTLQRIPSNSGRPYSTQHFQDESRPAAAGSPLKSREVVRGIVDESDDRFTCRSCRTNRTRPRRLTETRYQLRHEPEKTSCISPEVRVHFAKFGKKLELRIAKMHPQANISNTNEEELHRDLQFETEGMVTVLISGGTAVGQAQPEERDLCIFPVTFLARERHIETT